MRSSTRKKHLTSEVLIALRHELGLTQQLFAIKLGCAITSVGRWESSDPPAGETLVRLARFCNQNNQPQFRDKFMAAAVNGIINEVFWKEKEKAGVVVDQAKDQT